MRLARSLLRLYHARRALSLQRRSEWHADRALGLRRPEMFIPWINFSSLSSADLFLLASIVGVGIAGVWIGIVWRAM
jgi:hypothetical protein